MGRLQPVVMAPKNPFLHPSPSSAPPLPLPSSNMWGWLGFEPMICRIITEPLATRPYYLPGSFWNEMSPKFLVSFRSINHNGPVWRELAELWREASQHCGSATRLRGLRHVAPATRGWARPYAMWNFAGSPI